MFSQIASLAEELACVLACYGAMHRSDAAGRYFWRLIMLSFVVCMGAEIAITAEPTGGLGDLLFQFSSLPFGMALFLESDHKSRNLDPLQWSDLIQTLAVDHALCILHAARHDSQGLRAALEPEPVLRWPDRDTVHAAREPDKFAADSVVIPKNIHLLPGCLRCQYLGQPATCATAGRLV